MNKFRSGDAAFITESRGEVRKVVILRNYGKRYVVQFLDTAGGISINEDRLYHSAKVAKEAAKAKSIATRMDRYEAERWHIAAVRGDL